MSGVDPINYDVGELRQLATEDDEDRDQRRERGATNQDGRRGEEDGVVEAATGPEQARSGPPDAESGGVTEAETGGATEPETRRLEEDDQQNASDWPSWTDEGSRVEVETYWSPATEDAADDDPPDRTGQTAEGTMAEDGSGGTEWTPWEDHGTEAVTPDRANGTVGSNGSTREAAGGETATEETGGGEVFTYQDGSTASEPSISEEVAAALDAGSILGGGPADLLELEDFGEKPFLAYVPAETDHVVDEWMRFLVGRAGTDGALTAIDAYASAEWITVGVVVDLQSRIEGLERRPGDYEAMGRADHLRSLQYIHKIT